MLAPAYLLSATAFAFASFPGCASASSPGSAPREQASPDQKVTTLVSQFFPEHKSERVQFSYGPYTVPSMDEDNGMRDFEEGSVPLPCTECLITWMQAGLEYPDGSVANADNGMWLHHTVFSNLNRLSRMCPTEWHGDRFFASGNERTPINICMDGTQQAGYYIHPDDRFVMMVELMNMADQPRDAILTLTYEYIPSLPKGFDKVKSYWLDIGGCGSSELPAEPDTTFEYSSPHWKSNSTGRVTCIVNHLHDGGTHIELTKNGKVICDAKAMYGTTSGDPVSMSAEPEHISHMSDCTDLGPTKPGDDWSITAYYNTSKYTPMTNMDGSLEPVMGISLVYVAEMDHHHHRHHRQRNVILGCAIVTVLLALMMFWFKMKGRSLRDFIPGRKRGFLLGEPDRKFNVPLLSEEYHDRD